MSEIKNGIDEIRKDRWGRWLLVVYLALLAAAVVLVWLLGAPGESRTQKLGFITAGNAEDAGWNAMNYNGIRTACEQFGVELLVRDQIPEDGGKCLAAVEELADEGVEMVILTSPAYAGELDPYFEQFPQISFYCIYASAEAENLTSYSTRLYQARYLSGIIAGRQTRTGRIGFVASQKKSEVYRGIDAFALGVQRAAPEAEVVVAWTGASDDREKELSAARALIEDEGVDVITYHQDRDNVVDAAEEAGIASIGYYETSEGRSDNYLTCAACDWTMLYDELIREYQRGQSSSMLNNWLGLESGAVVLTDYSPLVSREARDEVERAKEEITAGRDVFTGEIYDNEGTLRCGEGESMSDETLMWNVDWLVKGVREYDQAP